MSKHYKKKIKNKINKKYLKVGDTIYYNGFPETITLIDFNYSSFPPGITTSNCKIMCSYCIYKDINNRQLTEEDFCNGK